MTFADAGIDIFKRIEADPVFSTDAIFSYLTRLLNAPAPNNGAQLPGAVGEVIGELAREFGLSLSDDARLQATGNLAIEIGAESAQADLVVSAHMDRPSFRVANLAEATLYPLCAIRVPATEYTCAAIAVAFENGRVKIKAKGKLQFRESEDGHHIRFIADSGELQWGDTVLMQSPLRRNDGLVIGTGLDNATGVLMGLLSARALSAHADDLATQGKKILFSFTDQEEGPPIGLFGQGAARLSRALPPPRLGFINIDAHNIDAATGHVQGIGASHAFVSGLGRGSVIPMEYQALATTLAQEVNQARPGTVRLNYGYVSRSDDMLLSTWARCLGLIGIPLSNAHTVEETVALGDLASGVRWVSAFVLQIL